MKIGSKSTKRAQKHWPARKQLPPLTTTKEGPFLIIENNFDFLAQNVSTDTFANVTTFFHQLFVVKKLSSIFMPKTLVKKIFFCPSVIICVGELPQVLLGWEFLQNFYSASFGLQRINSTPIIWKVGKLLQKGKNKLGLSWAKLSYQLGFGSTLIKICCIILINRK